METRSMRRKRLREPYPSQEQNAKRRRTDPVAPLLEHHDQFESLSYRQLQQQCKRIGLPAKGNTESIRKRLQNHLTSTQPKTKAQPISRRRQPPRRAKLSSVVMTVHIRYTWQTIEFDILPNDSIEDIKRQVRNAAEWLADFRLGNDESVFNDESKTARQLNISDGDLLFIVTKSSLPIQLICPVLPTNRAYLFGGEWYPSEHEDSDFGYFETVAQIRDFIDDEWATGSIEDGNLSMKYQQRAGQPAHLILCLPNGIVLPEHVNMSVREIPSVWADTDASSPMDVFVLPSDFEFVFNGVSLKVFMPLHSNFSLGWLKQLWLQFFKPIEFPFFEDDTDDVRLITSGSFFAVNVEVPEYKSLASFVDLVKTIPGAYHHRKIEFKLENLGDTHRDEAICAICLEQMCLAPMERAVYSRLNHCGHKYHTECLDKLLTFRFGNQCPLCKNIFGLFQQRNGEGLGYYLLRSCASLRVIQQFQAISEQLDFVTERSPQTELQQ